MSFSIYHDFIINSDINSVFNAITNPKELINWWPKSSTGKPSLNEEYNFYFSDEYDWYGKVISYEKNKSFHIQMIKSDDDWLPTSFGFDLETFNNSVKVKFSHINWPNCNNHFKRSSYCWAILLQGLKNYIEKGIIIPFEERE